MKTTLDLSLQSQGGQHYEAPCCWTGYYRQYFTGDAFKRASCWHFVYCMKCSFELHAQRKDLRCSQQFDQTAAKKDCSVGLNITDCRWKNRSCSKNLAYLFFCLKLYIVYKNTSYNKLILKLEKTSTKQFSNRLGGILKSTQHMSKTPTEVCITVPERGLQLVPGISDDPTPHHTAAISLKC